MLGTEHRALLLFLMVDEGCEGLKAGHGGLS